MKKNGLWLVLFGISMSILSCTNAADPLPKVDICTMQWFELVEEKIMTGDGAGHGPDVGSTEWRSVIEFKLGIRGDDSIPDLESEKWCEYINENFIIK